MSAAALNRIAVIVALAVAGMLCAPVTAQAQRPLDKVSFGTNWVAEAEHGGHYQALVDGTYRRYGLDVTIVPGGPNVNNRLLLPVGKLDFFMSGQHAAELRRGRAEHSRRLRSPPCSRRSRRC